MFSLLLCMIYLSFISLGLPDSLLGSAWPVMHLDLNAASSFAGVISMIITAGTVVSSLCSEFLTSRLGVGKITLLSTLVSALALLGFALSPSVWWMCLLALPYGLAAGSVDAALNHYVALHFSAGHMAWLHCFWGLGACISPYIMSACLAFGDNWRLGYGSVSALQFLVAVLLGVTLYLWKKPSQAEGEEEALSSPGLRKTLGVKGVKLSALSFCLYMALEVTVGVWASTYLVSCRGVDTVTAAGMASYFYVGITLARFVSGFIAGRLSDKAMVRWGVAAMLLGTALILIPVEGNFLCLGGLVITGIGGAPLYPSLVHATPEYFGKKYSQTVIGIEMATAYVGSTLAPPVFGAFFPLGSLPAVLFFLSVSMLCTTELLFKRVGK